jgi:hypothetical protein
MARPSLKSPRALSHHCLKESIKPRQPLAGRVPIRPARRPKQQFQRILTNRQPLGLRRFRDDPLRALVPLEILFGVSSALSFGWIPRSSLRASHVSPDILQCFGACSGYRLLSGHRRSRLVIFGYLAKK